MYDNTAWTEKQLTAAAEQARDYPDVIQAILVGNENVYYDGSGKYTAQELIGYIESMYGYLEEYGAR